jgi:ribosomal protein L24
MEKYQLSCLPALWRSKLNRFSPIAEESQQSIEPQGSSSGETMASEKRNVLLAQAIEESNEEKISLSQASSKEETQQNLLTALESKIEQLHSVMQNEDLEGTIHQVVDKLRKDSEAESEAERKHTDLHIAVDDLKAKLTEKSKQVKSYELALKATAQQLEELASISETRLKNAAEHGSRGLMTNTADDVKCQSCGLSDEDCHLQKMEFQELEDIRHQLAMTNDILVQGLSVRDKRIADLEGALKQFENEVSLQQAKVLDTPQGEVKEGALKQFENEVSLQQAKGLDTPQGEVKERALKQCENEVSPQQATGLDTPQGEVKCQTCGLGKSEFKLLDEARCQLAVTNEVLVKGLNVRDKHIAELEEIVKQFESEVQEAQASLQETNMQISARDSRIQRLEMELLCSAAAAASTPMPPPVQEQKSQTSVCAMRRSMQSPAMMSDTMQHRYENAKEALYRADKSLESGASGNCSIQGALAHMSTCAWISDFPQPFHNSSIHAVAASKTTSGASSPSQELPPLADVAGIYHPHPANRPH